jgi:hypothetical protein
MQMAFADHEMDTDHMEYILQPYYAQLLSFQLGLDTAYHEKKKVENKWHIRYRFFCKNQRWNESILYGEPGWESAVIESPPSAWRTMYPVF